MEASDVPHDLSAMGDWLGTLFAFFSPFGTDSRLHWTGLLAFLILGLAGFASQKRAGGPAADGAGADGATPGGPGALRGGGPLAFLFPPALYRTQSSLVDLKVYLAGRLVRPLIGAITCVAQSLVMAALAGLVAGGRAGDRSDPRRLAAERDPERFQLLPGAPALARGREALAFGVADRAGNREPQVHRSLTEASLVPFALSRRNAARTRHEPRRRARMTRGFSIYLDAIRFLAALLVLFSHLAYPRYSGGDLGWMRRFNLGSDAAIVFFVLSGLVIAHTTGAKNRTGGENANARLARL